MVCENFRPGTLERWHIGPDDCRPDLVWVRISVFGQDGPNADRPGLDRLGIGYGGLLHLTGEPDRPPVRPGVTISDYLTGVFAAMAAIAGLYRRDAGRTPDGAIDGTGGGAVIDAALYGSVLRVLEWTIAGYDQLGVVRGRQGNRLDNSAPLDNYPTADGTYVCIVAGSDANFRPLCTAMERPDLARRPGVVDAGQAGGPGRRDQRHRRRRGPLARTAAEVEAACIAVRRPGRPGLHRRRHRGRPAHDLPRGPDRRSTTPSSARWCSRRPSRASPGEDRPVPSGAPTLGADNDEVWGALVGADELARLRADRTI